MSCTFEIDNAEYYLKIDFKNNKLQIEVEYPSLLSSQLALLLRKANEDGMVNILDPDELNDLVNEVIHYYDDFFDFSEESDNYLFNRLKNFLSTYGMEVFYEKIDSEYTRTKIDISMWIMYRGRRIFNTTTFLRAKSNFLRVMLKHPENQINNRAYDKVKTNFIKTLNGFVHSGEDPQLNYIEKKNKKNLRNFNTPALLDEFSRVQGKVQVLSMYRQPQDRK